MKKRLFALLLAMLMVCALLPVAAMAEAEEPAAETVEETVEEVAEPEQTAEEPEEEPAEEPEGEAVEEPAAEAVAETEEPAEEPTEESDGEPAEEIEEELEQSEEEPALDEADPPPEESAIIYKKTAALGETTYIAIVNVKDGKAFKIDQGMGAMSVTVNGDELEATKGVNAKVTAVGGGFTLEMNDPPPDANFLYVEGGTLTKVASTGATAEDYAHWNMDANGLYYDAGGTKWYFGSAAGEMSQSPNADIVIFGGNDAPSGGGGGPEEEETDEYAPVFTQQPEGKEFVLEGGETEFEVAAKRTKKSDRKETTDGINFQWYLNGEALEGETNAKLKIDFTDKKSGVYAVYCEANYTEPSGTEHKTQSTSAAYIIAAGQTTDYLFFSDIHQEVENIADVLTGYMAENDGYLPVLVFATGDYCNGGGMADDTAVQSQLDAIDAMLAGLETIYLGGNHEASTLPIERNGGTGCIWNDGTYVYTINYDEITDGSYKDILVNVETFLKEVEKNPQPVIFVTHAGIHTLADWAGGDSYNIDLSDQMVDLLNKYGKKLNIFFFFGHDHSKGEAEFFKVAGDELTSTYNYSDSLNRTQTLNFTYGHMGYLNTKIGGSDTATVMKFGQNITLQRVGKDGYEGSSFVIAGAGGYDVPVVSALAKTATVGEKLKAVVASDKPDDKPDGEPEVQMDSAPPAKPDSKFDYQWYASTSSDTSAAATPIDGATKDSYTVQEADLGKYIFCKVTVKDSFVFATTTAAKIVDDSEEPQPEFEAGNYVIVLDDGSKTYAAVCGADGTITAEEVTVKDGKVVGPVGDEYLWIVKSKDGETIQNVGTDLFLNRTSAKDGGTAKINAIANGTSVWVYDDANALLYNQSTGGSTTYFYPTLDNGAFAMGKMSTVGAAEVSVSLLKVGTESDDEPIVVDLRIGNKEFYGISGGETLIVDSLDDISDITVLVQNGVDIEGMSSDWSMSTKFLDSQGRGVLEVQVFEEGEDYITFNLVSHYADCPGADVADFQIMMITAKVETSNPDQPNQPDQPEKPEKPEPKKDSKVPATGDNSHAILWALLALSLGAGAVVVTKKKFN